MSENTYFLKVAKADTEELLALAYGTLAEVAFVAKRQIKELSGSEEGYLLRFTEVSFIGAPDGSNDTKRTITSIAADGDTISAALKRKLAAEKKAQDAAPQQNRGSSEAPENQAPEEDRIAV
jgi:hypothetical protein